MIIERYLLKEYLKVWIFCVFSFVAILFVTRLREIAQFVTLGAQGKTIALFALYQIPYILPIVFPVAALIGAIVLMQRLSHNQELMALRASGKSMKSIVLPIFWASVILGFANFCITSELATESHLATRSLEHELRSMNPFLLLQNQSSRILKNAYLQTGKTSANLDEIEQLILAFWNSSQQQLTLFTGKNIHFDQGVLTGKNLTALAARNLSSTERPVDDLWMENIEKTTMNPESFSLFFKPREWRFQPDYLKMSLLWLYLQDLYQQKQEGKTPHQIGSIYTEMFRRLSIGLAVICFSLMGMAFGITSPRAPTFRKIYGVIALATVYLMCYFFAKRIEQFPFMSASLYFLPQLLIILLSARAFYKVSRGIE